MIYDVKTVLHQAKDLISDPNRWVKDTMKRSDKNGALCYCVLGALREVDGWEARDELLNALPYPFDDTMSMAQNIAAYNDHPNTTHADIMKLFDRAIASA